MREIIITSSVLIAVVLCIRFLARGKISPVLQYALWLPVAIRLILPAPLFSSSISILNLFPESLLADRILPAENTGGSDGISGGVGNTTDMRESNTGRAYAADGNTTDGADSAGSDIVYGGVMDSDVASSVIAGYDMANGGVASSDMADGGIAGSDMISGSMEDSSVTGIGAASGSYTMKSLESVLFPIWIAGMACTGGYMLFFQMRWKKYLYKNRRPLRGREIYRKKLAVYTVKGLPSPCLCGRSIYLTKEMAADEEQLAHILVHEYCHYRHLDYIWASVRCILTAVYWFHPLVWAAAYVSKQDSELACDEAAIRLLGEKERFSYGETLLHLIGTESCMRGRIGVASTMSGGEKGIRERIFRIAKKRKYVAAVSVSVVLLATAAIAVTFSGAGGQADAAMQEGKDETIFDESIGEAPLSNRELGQEEQLQELDEEAKVMEDEFKVVEDAFKKEVESASVLEKLAAFDKRVGVAGSRVGILDAKNPMDYWQAYVKEGESCLDEDIYLLQTKKNPDSSDIKVYGMYTKEFGLRGVKILTGDSINDFDEPWLISGMNGSEGNIALYETAKDGLPGTFAFQMLMANTGTEEVWNLYLCDRDDEGNITMNALRREAVAEWLQERLRFEIVASESKINVYDGDAPIGSIAIDASPDSLEKVEEVVCEGMALSYQLGSKEEEIRLFTAIGLRAEQTDEVWYRELPLLSFPLDCGSVGKREFKIGEGSVDMGTRCGMLQSAQSVEEWLGRAGNPLAQAFQGDNHYDVEISYINPCPDYTRISDTFGERTHPMTQEKIMHNGIDLAAPAGTDVLAAADGVVRQTGFDAENGNYVVLFHVASGEFTYYASCKEVLVEEGENVVAGQKIATVGSSGRSTGAHLHFGMSRDGEYIEPVFE